MRYRTPADVRAIPNEQWERWFRGTEPFPFSEFSAEAHVQKTLRTILNATERRLNLKRGRPRKPKPNDLRVITARMQLAYRMFAEHAQARGLLDLNEMDD